MKRTVHFIYVSPSPGRLGRAWNKISSLSSQCLPPVHQSFSYKLLNWPRPIFAPLSISYKVLDFFSSQGVRVRFYDWKDRGSVNLKEDDILIGHPACHMNTRPYQVDKESLLYQTLLKNKDHKHCYLFCPYNHSASQVSWFKDFFEMKPDLKAVFICGKAWIDSWEQSPVAEVLSQSNITQLNMCVDAESLPLVKNDFNQPAKRKYLYIGRCSPEKNISMLEQIAERTPGFEGGYISIGEIKGWKKISDFAYLTVEYMQELAKEYDIFINTSFYDAQATTVLEQMAFGMAVACTPESGTKYDSVYELSTDDLEHNLRVLEKLQNETKEVLLFKAKENRKLIKANHHWDSFLNQLKEAVL